MFWLARTVTDENQLKENEAYLFNELQMLLSTTEYRKVLYSPNLKRYSWNSTVSYEDDELIYCLNLLRNDGVTYHAILRYNYIHVVSKNAS